MITSMLSRPFWKYLTLILLAGLIFHPGLAQAGKSYQADSYDVLLEIQPGGWMLVTETVTFRFSGGPFSYVFRDINPVETDGIEVLQAKMDGESLPAGKSPGQVELRPGDPYHVEWHFSPLSDETHTFELTYQVRGVIRKSDSGQDLLLWRAIPEQHDYPILHSSITLQVPETAQVIGQPDLVLFPSQIETGLHRFTLSTQDIRTNQEVMVEAHFQPGSLISAPPHWQAHQAEVKRRTTEAVPLGIGVFLAVLIAGIFIFRWVAPLAFSSHPPVPITGQISSPPGSLAPAPATWLVSTASSFSAMLPLVTLFDLARRGALRIEEQPSQRLKGRSYMIESQDLGQAWLPHEQDLLRFLFENEPSGQGRVSFSDISKKLPAYTRKFVEILSMELRSANLLDPEREKTRQQIQRLSVIGLLLGVGIGVAAAITIGLASRAELWVVFELAIAGLAAGAAVFVLGLVILFVSAHYTIWTEAGDRLAAQWRGYESYLREVAKGRIPAGDSRQFDQGLPYAFGFGLGKDWVQAFQKQGSVQIPAWFQAAGGAIQDEMASMAFLMSAADGFAGDGGAGGGGAGSGGGASGAG